MFDLDIEPEKIITSGTLLKTYFEKHRLVDARCVVLGPEDSRRYVEMAGGRVVEFDDAFDVLIVGDESGYPFLETIDLLLGKMMGKLKRNEPMHLILPNPDLIYPKGDRGYGFTSGSIALILEAALQLRYPSRPELKFTRLGKPHAAIFRKAQERSGTRNMVMIGDQLETDIRGAVEFGLDAALVNTGITNLELNAVDASLQPTYYLDSLTI